MVRHSVSPRASGDWQEGRCRKALALPAVCTSFAPRRMPALAVDDTELCTTQGAESVLEL